MIGDVHEAVHADHQHDLFERISLDVGWGSPLLRASKEWGWLCGRYSCAWAVFQQFGVLGTCAL